MIFLLTAFSHCIILWEIKQSRNLWSLSQNRCEPNFINVHACMPLDFFCAGNKIYLTLFVLLFLTSALSFWFQTKIIWYRDNRRTDHSSVAVRRYVCGWRDDNKDACVSTKNTASGKSADFCCLLQENLNDSKLKNINS